MHTTDDVIARRWALIAVALAIGLSAIGVAMFHTSTPSGATPGAPATTALRTTSTRAHTTTTDQSVTSSSEDTSGSTTTVSTTQSLLNGPVASTTTTTTPSAANLPDKSATAKRTINWKVWAIVAGLLLVAVLMGVLTVRYWRRTRPTEEPKEGVSGGVAFTVPEPNYDDEADNEGRRKTDADHAAGTAIASPEKNDDPLIAKLAAEAAGTDSRADESAADDNARHPRRTPRLATEDDTATSTLRRAFGHRRTSRYADLEISVPPASNDDSEGTAVADRPSEVDRAAKDDH